jgi:DNA-binding CsgD family transcriptional regulator
VKAGRGDLLAVVDAAHRLDQPATPWLRDLRDTVLTLDTHIGEALAYTYRWDPTERRPRYQWSAHTADDPIGQLPQRTERFADPAQIAYAYAGASHCVASTDVLGGQLPTGMSRLYAEHDIGDFIGVIGRAGDTGLVLGLGLRPGRRLALPLRRSLAALSAELSSAMGLRAQLTAGGGIEAADAVFTPDGRCEHAASDLHPAAPRRALRERVRRRERLRGQRPADPARALAWDRLLSGRWHIVDCFDTDGRRFLVLQQRAAPSPLRMLDDLDKRLVTLAADGASNKRIALTLGLSESAVTRRLAPCLARLGLRHRHELIRVRSALLLARHKVGCASATAADVGAGIPEPPKGSESPLPAPNRVPGDPAERPAPHP